MVGVEEKKNNYFFPNVLAELMSKVDIRTQLEATLMSTSLIIVGLMLSVVYSLIYMDLQTWFKIMILINGIAGFFFMSSHLVTTFQQYKNAMEVISYQNETKELSKDVKGGKEQNAKTN